MITAALSPIWWAQIFLSLQPAQPGPSYGWPPVVLFKCEICCTHTMGGMWPMCAWSNGSDSALPAGRPRCHDPPGLGDNLFLGHIHNPAGWQVTLTDTEHYSSNLPRLSKDESYAKNNFQQSIVLVSASLQFIFHLMTDYWLPNLCFMEVYYFWLSQVFTDYFVPVAAIRVDDKWMFKLNQCESNVSAGCSLFLLLFIITHWLPNCFLNHIWLTSKIISNCTDWI